VFTDSIQAQVLQPLGFFSEIADGLTSGTGDECLENLQTGSVRHRSGRAIDETEIANPRMIAAKSVLLIGSNV